MFEGLLAWLLELVRDYGPLALFLSLAHTDAHIDRLGEAARRVLGRLDR